MINTPGRSACIFEKNRLKHLFTRDIHGEGVTALSHQIEGHTHHGHPLAGRSHGQDALHTHRPVRILMKRQRLRLDGLKTRGVFWTAGEHIKYNNKSNTTIIIKYDSTIIKAAHAERVILDNLEPALITLFCFISAKQIQYLFLTNFEMLIPKTVSVQEMFNSQLISTCIT